MSNTEIVLDLINKISNPDEPLNCDKSTVFTKEELNALIGSARVAPSADNAQIWRFITVEQNSIKENVSTTVSPTLSPCFKDASCIIAVCGFKWKITRVKKEQPFIMIDVPIALTHILMQATELGINYVWTLDFDESPLLKHLSIPKPHRVVGLIALVSKN